MQLTNTPGKLVLPFANAGAKNTIPTASQIGITAGAASLVDGFPPLTRTPIAAGGVPPSGLDMNGILYELSAILRWANAGGGYVYDSTFANDANVGGYPKGARIMRSDGLGYWFNTVENNTTDPEANAVAAIAAGWVPDFANGVSAVAMTNANVTLTPLQYGKPVIVISGVLTANLNLIFPTGMVGEWVVINNTTGAFTVTCKTAAGTGVIINTAQLVVGDGTNIYRGNIDAVATLGALIASAGGTADALTFTLPSTVRSWAQIAGVPFWVRAAAANATTTPTAAANSLAAKTIVKGANAALIAGEINGAGHWLLMQYDATLDKVVLLNPAYGVNASGYMLVRDEKLSGTAGGASIAGTQIRTLNTVVANTIPGASLSINQIILPAGTYRVRAHSPSNGVNLVQALLYNSTDSVVIAWGTSDNGTLGGGSDPATVRSLVDYRFTLSAAKALELRMYTDSVFTTGLGSAVSQGTEVYSVVELIKE